MEADDDVRCECSEGRAVCCSESAVLLTCARLPLHVVRVCAQGPPLIHAAQHGELAMAELLLSCGADIGARDMSGSSALHEACAAGHVAAARLLLAHGASLAAANQDGDQPLDLLGDDAARQELLEAASSAAAAAAAAGSAGPGGRPGLEPPSPSRPMSRLKGVSAMGPGSALSSPGRLQLAGGHVPVGLPRSPSKGPTRAATAGAATAGAAAGAQGPGTGADRSQAPSRLQSARLQPTASVQPSPRQPPPETAVAGPGGGGGPGSGGKGQEDLAAVAVAGQPPETLMCLTRARLVLHSRAADSPGSDEGAGCSLSVIEAS